MFISDYIEIRESNLHGLGVFAKKDIPKRTKIEVSPGILLTKKPQNILFKYCYISITFLFFSISDCFLLINFYKKIVY